MDKQGPKIFISYRRAETADVTGRIRDRLIARWGQQNVFLDATSIEPGRDFFDAVVSAITSCDAVLVVMCPKWLGATDQSGHPRLHQTTDPVRREIEAALAHNKRIIPLLAGGAIMPRQEDLPDVISGFALRHAMKIRTDPDFDHDIRILIDSLSEGRRDEIYLAERTYLRFRDVPCSLLDSAPIVSYLERRHGCSALVVGATKLPVSITWQNAGALIPPDLILGDLDQSTAWKTTRSAVLDPVEYEHAREYIKTQYEAPPSKVKYEGIDYRMVSIDLSGETPRINGALGRYYDTILTQYAMEWELKKALLDGLLNRLDEHGVLPLREAVESGRNPQLDGNGRCAALTISTLLVFQREWAGSTGLYTLVRKRSSSVGVSPNLHHVAPAGMFESPNTEDTWSITENIWRELLEEVYDDQDEIGVGISGIRDHIHNKQPIRLLRRLIQQGRAELSVTGIVWDLLNLRSEVCTVLYVPETAFTTSRKMAFNWEYEPEGSGGVFAMKWEKSETAVAQLAAEGLIAVGGAACFALGRDWIRTRHHL